MPATPVTTFCPIPFSLYPFAHLATPPSPLHPNPSAISANCLWRATLWPTNHFQFLSLAQFLLSESLSKPILHSYLSIKSNNCQLNDDFSKLKWINNKSIKWKTEINRKENEINFLPRSNMLSRLSCWLAMIEKKRWSEMEKRKMNN